MTEPVAPPSRLWATLFPPGAPPAEAREFGRFPLPTVHLALGGGPGLPLASSSTPTASNSSRGTASGGPIPRRGSARRSSGTDCLNV
jgi:hypothetical protein